MTVTTNTNYDTKNALDYERPAYLIEFDGVAQTYGNIPIEDGVGYEALQVDGVDLSIDGEVLQTEQT